MRNRWSVGLTLACVSALMCLPALAEVTRCDELAAHPEDPDRVSPGRATRDIDLAEARRACEQDLAAAPRNARLRYQLSRVLFYAGEHAEAMTQMRQAADAGHPQAQFVYGVFVVRQRPHAPADVCLAEHYWRLSALAGRQAAPINYVLEHLRGRFDACEVKPERAELMRWLDVAHARAPDGYAGYYERLLIEDLRLRLAAA